jgi:hypothetical protein
MEKLGYNPVDKVVVHDRFFYPEFVYGPVLRGGTQGSRWEHNYVRDFLRSRAFLIYCRPPIGVLRDGAISNPQMKGVLERFDDLLLHYDQLMIDEAPHYNGRFVRYDYTNNFHLDILLKKLAGYIY